MFHKIVIYFLILDKKNEIIKVKIFIINNGRVSQFTFAVSQIFKKSHIYQNYFILRVLTYTVWKAMQQTIQHSSRKKSSTTESLRQPQEQHPQSDLILSDSCVKVKLLAVNLCLVFQNNFC